MVWLKSQLLQQWSQSTVCNYSNTTFTTVFTNGRTIYGNKTFRQSIKKSVKNILVGYYMSTPTTPQMPHYPGYPYGYDNTISVQEQILAAVTGNAEQTKQQAANDIARDIVRAVENNGHIGASTTERTAAQLAQAIERNGAFNASTTERVNSQLATAVERNGANLFGAVERVAGEGRLTTVVSDAASRQASNDSARDILAAVERNGFSSVATTKDTHNGLLGAIERNAGENRMTTVTVGGQNDVKLANVHNGLSTQLNNVEGDILSTVNLTASDIKMAVANSAWESRTGISTGFAAAALENAKSTSALLSKTSDHYASLMMEQQKMGQFITSKADNHFAMNQLEMQKVKEGLAAQAAQNFASTQLESLKNFASAQLEAQKNREAIQQQLCDAKYEALKSQQFLADKIDECCCSVKEKMDSIDRDNLRDNLDIARDKNAIQDGINFQQLLLGRAGPLGGYGPGPWGGYGPEFGGYGAPFVNVDVNDRGHRHHHDRRRGGDGRR